MDSYEFELFAFWDDLEYADDPYWDYGLYVKDNHPAGGKRKREAAQKAEITDKRRKTRLSAGEYSRDDDPLLFVSRAQRTRTFFEPAPLLEDPVKYTFLADWRERFSNVDGVIEDKPMPVDMKRAAEAEALDVGEGMDDDEVEGEWEDEDDDQDNGQEELDEEDHEDEPNLDRGMLEEILKHKLGGAGLADEDRAAFMQVIAKMMSGESDADDATGDLANSLLGKLTSGIGGDSALSGWLSQQGVSLEDGEDDDASSVATVELPEGLRHSGLSTRQSAQDSPIDSVVGGEAHGKTAVQMPLHPGSPTSSTKKRAATTSKEDKKPSKKQKQVKFDVSASSSSDLPAQNASSDDAKLPTSEDPLMSASTLKSRSTPRRSAGTAASESDAPAEAINEVDAKPRSRTTRKRKAADAEVVEEKPEKKKTRKKEVDMLEDAVAASPMGPPARRTRAAKAKAGK